MKGRPAMPGARVAMAATACGPCSATSARSGSGLSATPAGSTDSM